MTTQTQQTQTHTFLYRYPIMHGRSLQEIEYHAEWLHRLGYLTIDNLSKALCEGDKRGRMDACFVGLEGVPSHGSEFDGEFYHNDVEADKRKTKRMLAYADLQLVCRVRIGDTPILDMKDERLRIVYSKNIKEGIEKMSGIFAKHSETNEDIKRRLTDMQNNDLSEEAKQVAKQLYDDEWKRYDDEFARLKEIVGDETAAKAVEDAPGVKTRLSSGIVAHILRRLQHRKYKITDLTTFMRSGIAAQFDDEGRLFRILDKLIAPPYNVKDLQTFMCGSVVAQFKEEDKLFRILDRLIAPPYNVKSLQTFMCNSAAAHFKDEERLFHILDRLIAPPYHVKSLQTFMCDSAAFNDEDGLFHILDRLIAPRYGIQSLQTFVCGGIMKQLKNDEEKAFRILDRLVAPPYEVNLQTIVNDSFAARFEDEGKLFRILGILADSYNINLNTSFVPNIAILFDDEENLYDILDRLRGDPYNIKELEKFLYNGAATRFRDDKNKTFGILDRLVAAPYNVKTLENFMCAGLASRFDDDNFFYILDRLMAPPCNVKSLEDFMCDRITAHFGIGKKSTPKLKPETFQFRDGIVTCFNHYKLDTMFHILKKLVVEYEIKLDDFICNSVVYRFDNEKEFFDILDRLKKDYGIKDLQGFFCPSVAARFQEKNEMFGILDTFRTKYEIKNLEKFVGAGLANQLKDPENVYKVLDKLRAKSINIEEFVCDTTASLFGNEGKDLFDILGTIEDTIDKVEETLSNNSAVEPLAKRRRV